MNGQQNNPTYEQLQNILDAITETNSKLDTVLNILSAIHWGVAFAIGVFACAYLFNYFKGAFEK